MSEIKHTPGPWIWADGYRGLYGAGKDNQVLDYAHYEGMWLGHVDEQKANARLIAAAPELLEALQSLDKRFRLCMEHCVTASEAYDSFYQEIVSEAIAKATGAA